MVHENESPSLNHGVVVDTELLPLPVPKRAVLRRGRDPLHLLLKGDLIINNDCMPHKKEKLVRRNDDARAPCNFIVCLMMHKLTSTTSI
jgi:hypothetical protein